MTSADVVAEARSLLGIPFGHQGRGTTLDCAGLLIEVGDGLGVRTREGLGAKSAVVKNYRRRPERSLLVRELRKHLIECSITDIAPGRVVVFGFDKTFAPCHVGIITDRPRGVGVVHASPRVGRVVEHLMSDEWRQRVRMVFRFPGVD